MELSSRKFGTKRRAAVSINAYSTGRWKRSTSALAMLWIRVVASMHKKARVMTSMRRPPNRETFNGEPNSSCNSTIMPVNTPNPPMAASMVLLRLIYKSSTSCNTKIVATASSGRINTQAVTASVTIIQVKAFSFIRQRLLSRLPRRILHRWQRKLPDGKPARKRRDGAGPSVPQADCLQTVPGACR